MADSPLNRLLEWCIRHPNDKYDFYTCRVCGSTWTVEQVELHAANCPYQELAELMRRLFG